MTLAFTERDKSPPSVFSILRNVRAVRCSKEGKGQRERESVCVCVCTHTHITAQHTHTHVEHTEHTLLLLSDFATHRTTRLQMWMA